jgi:hypothetical protein
MKFTGDRTYADPDKAARKLVDICNSIEPCRMAGSTLRRSMRRSFRLAAVRRNTAPG